MIIKNFQTMNLETFKLTDELVEIINSLYDNCPNFSTNYILPKLRKDAISINSRKLFESLSICLHKIPYISTNTINVILSTTNNTDQVIERITEEEININPFEVPISFCDENVFYGKCTPLYINFNDRDLLIFNEFQLSRNTHILSPSIYSHEIIHSQLESKNNSITNYLNYEVLPVFFDKITTNKKEIPDYIAKTNDLLRIKQLIKAYNLLNNENLPYFSQVKLSMIIVSILKSEILFELYINSNKNNKIKIINEIQSILDGKFSIEVFLDKNNINLENNNNLEILKKRLVTKNRRISI